MRKARVFIWGSCVSRDTFQHFPDEKYELARYVARQSALSASSSPVKLMEPPKLPSSFQQRMISGDFASNLKKQFAETSGNVDLILIDLTDERLGVYLLPDGSIVTRSVELIQSGWETSMRMDIGLIPFGSDEHFERWSHSMVTTGEFIRQSHPTTAVALLEIPWAARSETGEATPLSFGMASADANAALQRYYRVAEQALGATAVTLPEQSAISSPKHPWGEAPFHYAESVYIDAARMLTGLEC